MTLETKSNCSSERFTYLFSPYYLHPSDDPSTALVSCLLTGENYQTWRRVMINTLNAKNKAGFVDGTIKKSDRSKTMEWLAWSKCNSMVISWIFNALVQELHQSIAYICRECQDLEQHFSQGNAPRIFQLKRNIALLKQDDLVVVYYTKMKGIWDELATFSRAPTCSCGGAAKEFIVEKENEYVFQFLVGLNERFTPIRSSILGMEPLPDITKVYALVSQEENYQELAIQQASTVEAVAMNVAAQPQGGNFKNSNGKPKLRCNHCKKQGHTKDHCYEIFAYPPNWETRGRSKGKAPLKTNNSKPGSTNPNTEVSPINGLSHLNNTDS
ncbi:PREDICTED: uncharacterized protein LOC109115783 [Nelumbo nucifera]|uniref:Uncharacterized protein LOC109115783 n=1 Tax=Nelumbo nucifera TaxID=4432 RepID=A0A1U8QAU9_NELNU|nr:PREDICTED: uncharacterized protein LOC109115783 [Nelumbo nucifera]